MTTFSRKQLIFGSIICTIGAFFYCYEFILRIVPGVLQNELTVAFGNISASTFGQISALYYFAYSPMQLPVGMLMDRYGPRRLLTLACLCCTIGSYMFSYSTSIPIAGSGRFLVGFGSAFAFVGVLTSAVNWLPPRFFSLVAGLMTTLGMLGLIYGEVKITELASTLSLSSVLMLLVLMGLILAVFIFLVVRDAPNGISTKRQTFTDFFRSVLQVLMSRQVWLIGFVGACLYTSLSVFGELWGKSYLENAHHLTKENAATAISMMFLGWAVGAPLSGYLSDHTGRRIVPLLMGAACSLVCISIILYYPGLSFFSLNWLMFLYGLFSSVEIIVFVMAKENSGALLSGTVFAAVNMIVTLGGVIFQPLVGTLLDTFGEGRTAEGIHVYSVHDYQLALSVIPISLVLMIATTFFLKEQRKKTRNSARTS
ncbi:MAG: MFS transporter [Legionellaceae bacterium]|nr:MFS transporter [Legionellaceae bacterium]